MSANETSNLDDRGFAVEWLELLNPTASDIDLLGYSLSDDWTVPQLSVLPALTIPAGGYLLLWADSSPQAGDRHLAFGLARGGESVGLFDPSGEPLDWVEFPPLDPDVAWSRVPDGSPRWRSTVRGTPENGDRVLARTELIPRGAVWRYSDGDVDLGADWREPGHDDSGWAQGAAPLGYGDPVTTELSFGGDPANKAATAYFRFSFQSEVAGDDPSAELEIELRKDDGAIVYLNGAEVLRRGMPAGDVGADTFANFTASGTDETDYVPGDLDPQGIVQGTNVLAVEVHQTNASSSDLVMDLSLALTSWISAE